MSESIHVLVAVDGSDESTHAASVAARLFGEGARFSFAHVAEPIPMTPPGRLPFSAAGVAPVLPPDVEPDQPGGEHEVRDSARSIALAAAGASGLEVAETIGLIGDPAKQIVAAANERSADVIVVAVHHRGWLTELFTSSVTDDIQHLATIPVLVVPERQRDD